MKLVGGTPNRQNDSLLLVGLSRQLLRERLQTFVRRALMSSLEPKDVLTKIFFSFLHSATSLGIGPVKRVPESAP